MLFEETREYFCPTLTYADHVVEPCSSILPPVRSNLHDFLDKDIPVLLAAFVSSESSVLDELAVQCLVCSRVNPCGSIVFHVDAAVVTYI